MDRRRRVLMESADAEARGTSHRGRRREDEGEDAGPKRGAGYSHDVRRACGQRLVQLIPVRRRSYAAVIITSVAIPAMLLIAHYMVYVSGNPPWFGHPLAVSLDASHQDGIAAWLSSHVWLLCLGATLLTFQIRRHKLDDYEGEYRLWFWLVVTCLAASMDATTNISDYFGLALNNWSQINLGWSGSAVVDATLAVLIGMLGLRLCTELKSVPTSLALWLVGLVAWAGSAALAQDQFRIDFSLQIRIWLKCALWLGGLTAVWLAAVSYLRAVYIDAQRKFLARSRMATAGGVPIGRRLKDSFARLPGVGAREDSEAGEERKGWNPLRRKSNEAEPAIAEKKTRRRNRTSSKPDPTSASAGPSSASTQPVASRKPAVSAKATTHKPTAEDEDSESPKKKSFWSRLRKEPSDGSESDDTGTTRPSDKLKSAESQSEEPKRGRLASWIRQPKHDEDAAEFHKVRREKKPAKEAKERTKATRGKRDDGDQDDGDAAPRKSWMPKLKRPKMPSIPRPNVGKLMSKVKLPSLRLPPPEPDSDEAGGMRSVNSDASLPGTSGGDADDDASSGSRPMTKAERKRMRRLQQKQNRAA